MAVFPITSYKLCKKPPRIWSDTYFILSHDIDFHFWVWVGSVAADAKVATLNAMKKVVRRMLMSLKTYVIVEMRQDSYSRGAIHLGARQVL